MLQIAGPGYKQMSVALWIKITVRLRVRRGEKLSVHSPILVRENKGKLVPMTAQFMAAMDKRYASMPGWLKMTIHSRRRGFATAAVRHMTSICIAMRHSQGVTIQYVALSLAQKAAITTRLAIASYDEYSGGWGCL